MEMIVEGNGEIERLFRKVLTVCIKEGCSSQSRKTSLLLTVERHSLSIPLLRKELIVRLTDDCDPFFLYTLNLSEEDFQSLKTQQGLLVDFAAFPQKFTELLELCLQEEQKEIPRFLLSLSLEGKMGFDSGPAQLNIVETNPFKHLTHLSLQLVPASDINVKKYLAKCLKALKEEKEQLESRLKITEADLQLRLSQCQDNLVSRTHELEKARKEFKAQLNNCERRHCEELAAEKERLLKINQEDEERWSKDRKEQDQSHHRKTQQLEARVSCLDSLNKELQEKQYKSETTIRELRTRVLSLEEEVKQLNQRLQSLIREKSHVDSELNEQGKLLGQLKTKISNLEQEAVDKEVLLAKLQEQLRICQEQKKKIEDTLEQKQSVLSKRESSLKSLSEELSKGNEIIRKLQAEIHNSHAKLQMRGKIAMKQEEVLGEKEEHLEHLEEELATTKDQLKEKERENKQLSETVKNISIKLEDSDKQLKVNENVIKWLNKQLTTSQINHQKTSVLDPSSNVVSLRQHASVIPPGIRHIDNLTSGTLPSTMSSTFPKSLAVPTSTFQVSSTHEQGTHLSTTHISGNPAFRSDSAFTAPLPSYTLSSAVTPSVFSGGPLDQRYFQRHTSPVSSQIPTTSSHSCVGATNVQTLPVTSHLKPGLRTVNSEHPITGQFQSAIRTIGAVENTDCLPRSNAPCPNLSRFPLASSKTSTPLQPT